ncbi:MAG: tetratricopeptide repeat protein [Candidatus Eremiobacteraeota bacterium]|nr:tetratricopeptide repeat protein [Candidatus Eremiobacteraeota bacterium]
MASSSSAHTLPGSDVDTDRYLVCLVGAAIAGEATFVELEVSKQGTEARFDGRHYTAEDFETMAEADPSEERERFGLAVTLGVLMAREPHKLSLESWNGSAGARIKLSDGSLRVERLNKCPWKGNEAGNRLRAQFQSVWKREFFGKSSDEPLPECDLLLELCELAPSRIELNGKSIVKPVDPGASFLWVFLAPEESRRALRLNPVSPQAKVEHRVKTEGAYSAVLALGGDEGELEVVANGVRFPVEIPLLSDLGFRGVIACSELNLSDDQTELEEDDLFEALLTEVESDVLGLTPVILEHFDKADEEVRQSLLSGLDTVVEMHRSSAEFQEAHQLLERLLEARQKAYGEDDPAVAETLTALAGVAEALGQWEECCRCYETAVRIWDEAEEPDLRSLAVCLNGLAQIYYTAEEFAACEELAARALEIRSQTHEDDELELGVSCELLGRVYSTLYTYPHKRFLEVEKLYQQALKILEKNYGSHHADVAVVLHDLGEYYRVQRRFEEAETVYLRSLAIREKLLGGSDPTVGETLDTLGSLYEDQGQSTKAGRYYLKALQIWDKILGPEHPEVAQRLNNLVVLYRVYGKYAEAEPLYERILTIRERSLGADHPELVPDLVSMALLFQVQSKYDAAEKQFLRALAILEKAHGKDAEVTDLAWIHNLLGALYDEQYSFKKAEEHLNRALDLWIRILGPKHPDVAESLDYLVRHFRIQQRYNEAAPLAQRALAVNEQFFGTSHPVLATSLNTLGDLLRLGGQPEQARPLYRAAWEIRMQSSRTPDSVEWTPNLEQIGDSRFTSSRVAADQLHREAVEPSREYSRYMEAEHLYLRALFTREEVLGPGHPNNARTLDCLAELYRTHHKFEGAESLHERSLELRRKSLGREHPDTLVCLRNLVETYLMQQKFDEAEPHAKKWLEVAQLTVGEEHLETANAYFALAPIYEHRGDPKVEEAYRRSMEIRQKLLGVENPDFATSLAELLRVRGDFEQSAKLYSFVVTSMEEALGGDSVELIPVLEKYASVLKKTGNEEEAVPYETQAMVMRVQYGLDFH